MIAFAVLEGVEQIFFFGGKYLIQLGKREKSFRAPNGEKMPNGTHPANWHVLSISDNHV